MSSRRMELTGLHSDIVEAGSFTQIRDANIPVAWCANHRDHRDRASRPLRVARRSFLATINIVA